MAVGAVAVGSAVIGAFTTVAVSATVAGIVGGMIIGAAIGGITAAITGGSIGKGILFGAIGGAVAGGVSGYFAGAGTTVGAAASGGSNVATGSVMGTGGGAFQVAGTNMVGGTMGATSGVMSGASGSLVSKAGETMLSKGVEGGINILGKSLEGSAMEDMNKDTLKQQAAELDKKLAGDKYNTDAQVGASMYGTDKQLEGILAKIGEDRRQFDTQLGEATAARERAGSALAQANVARKGVLKGTDSVQEQLAAENESFRVAPNQLEEGQIIAA